MDKKLSILIPVFNSEHYIERCLDSVFNQNLDIEDFEVLVMDDNSTDNTSQIIKRYSTTYTNISFFSGPKVGVYKIRNKLLALAKGEYVYFLDSDDYLINGALQTILQLANENKLEGIGFKTQIITNPNQKRHEHFSNSFKLPNVENGMSILASNKKMRHEIWWYLVKKDFLLKHDIVFAELPFSSDVMFTLKVFESLQRFMFLPISVHRYVQVAKSITNNVDDEHQAKLITSQVAMITELSSYITSLGRELPNYTLIRENLIFRRDVYTFFVIARMIKVKIPIAEVKKYISLLRDHSAYPVNHFIGEMYNSYKFRFLNYIFNKPFCLYFLINLNRLIPKRY